MRESGHKWDSSWSKWWISCGWVVYLWSDVSQIESAILSQTVTLDIEPREATAKKTAPNQADCQIPFHSENCANINFQHVFVWQREILWLYKDCIWLACRGTHLSPNMTWPRERGKKIWLSKAKRSRSWNAAPSMGHFVPGHGEMEFRIGIWNKYVICEFMGETSCVNLLVKNPALLIKINSF